MILNAKEDSVLAQNIGPFACGGGVSTAGRKFKYPGTESRCIWFVFNGFPTSRSYIIYVQSSI